MAGYVKEYRSIMEWEWYTDYKTAHLFRHCIYKANYEPKKWRGIDIGVGQFVTSLAHLAEETGLSIQNVRTSLKKLKSTQELTYETTSQNTIITINNYNKYQESNTLSNKQLTNNQQAINKQLTTTKEIKEYKEIKEKKNIDIFCNVDFEKCFSLYSENCPKLIPLRFEKRSRAILDELNNFLIEIDYDFSYFLNLCQKANELEKIVDSRIDFKMLIKNHIGIMNGKYETKSGTMQERKNAAISDFFAQKREVTNG